MMRHLGKELATLSQPTVGDGIAVSIKGGTHRHRRTGNYVVSVGQAVSCSRLPSI